jgi:lipid-A-disaccharide synthase-like uncharacterized protein
MGKMPTHIRGFIQDMKPLYYVAKMLGLAPFTLKIDAATNEEIIDIKLTSNIRGFTASAITIIVLLIGFVFATFLPQFSLRQDPVVVLTYVVSVPVNFICSLVLVIMNSTVNRYKIEKLVKKLTSVDKRLTILPTGYSSKRSGRNIQLFMPILVLAVIILSLDVYLAVDKFNLVFCIIERSCEIITLVALMQYCKMALTIRARLSVTYEILSRTFCKRLSRMNCDNFGTGALNVTSNVCSQTCTTLHKSRFILRDDFEAFNGNQRNIKMPPVTEVELLLKLRRIYYHLCECVKYINFMYGLPILIHIFHTAIGMIVVPYNIGIFFEVHPGISYIIPVIIWTIILLGSTVTLTVICDLAASKTKDIEHKFQALLLIDNISSDVEKQLQLFCQQMSKDRIAFTAAGLFDVNLSFLCTFLTSIMTYMVVLIQFKLQ